VRIRALTAGLLLLVATFAAAPAVVAVTASPAAAQATTPTTVKGPNKFGKECIDKLEKGGKIEDCQKAPSPILPATNELVWGIISFAVLVFLLGRFAYPTLKKGMDARSDRIRNSIDEAERTRAEAQTILDEYQRQLADAKSEAARIIEEARQAADRLRHDLRAQAEAEIAELKARANEDVRNQVDRAMADLQHRVGQLSIELAEKVVGASLDRDANMRLIEAYINEVGAQN
jgi:F-type H+-transporting ATPase subunit b